MGKLNSVGETQGHYICDVKHFATKEWFRTNDCTNPTQISSVEVSKYGYIALYSRTKDPNVIV